MSKMITYRAGTLPAAWAAPGAFPALEQLLLWGTNLTGTLPATWGDSASFPSLQQLYIGNNNLTGTLPEQYGLYIQHCKITGKPIPWLFCQCLPDSCASLFHVFY